MNTTAQSSALAFNDASLAVLVRRVGDMLKSQTMMLATAESCTGGWIAKLITDVPGSSHWFERGFVTYTNESKQEMLGVKAETLVMHGAVSEAAVREMARGALNCSRAQVSVSVSGIAGPGGGSVEKPVGTVCFAWAMGEGGVRSEQRHFEGDREAVRRQAVATALNGILELVQRL